MYTYTAIRYTYTIINKHIGIYMYILAAVFTIVNMRRFYYTLYRYNDRVQLLKALIPGTHFLGTYTNVWINTWVLINKYTIP